MDTETVLDMVRINVIGRELTGLEKSRECARYHAAQGFMCGGCHMSSVCGIYENFEMVKRVSLVESRVDILLDNL